MTAYEDKTVKQVAANLGFTLRSDGDDGYWVDHPDSISVKDAKNMFFEECRKLGMQID